jgi:hypothetical protein
MVSKTLENNAQVLCMLFLIFGIYQDVVNENRNELVKFGHEYRIHEIHEVDRSICETERHDQILIYPVSCGKGSLRDITRTNLDR